MPEQIYIGLTTWYYPATRDARGFLLGEVEPDDIRDLDEAPDLKWRPVTGDDRARIAAKAQDGSGMADEPPHPPAVTPAAGPVPAPPAVLPAITLTPAGVTGTEEG